MSFRLLIAAFLVAALFASAQAQEKYRVYFGTYTGKGSMGIYQCELNLKDGSLSAATLAGETSSPSFLAFHPNKKFLYAVNEGQAAVSAFAIDDKTGNLTFLNSQPSQGGAPCHLVVDPTGKNVLAANYGGGSCICIPIEAEGKLGNASSFQQHEGKRKNGHSIHVDQANKFALCCDLGLDKVIIYAFDADKGTLRPHGAFDTPKGSGPRHFAWHPDGKTAYVNGESNLTIIVCDYDAEKGVLTQKQVLSTLPKDVKRKGGSTAETVVHPSGKFVYVSNRDPYNSIAIFSIDPQTRKLTAVGHQGKGVKTPRNFAIEPTGQYMLVANQSGGNVIVFRINQTTGELTPTKASVQVSSPVCVRFMEIWLGTKQDSQPELEIGKPISLFDGKTLNGWGTQAGKPITQGWKVEDGAIYRDSRGGNILYEREVGDFELKFEWKIVKGGNNGLKYRVRKYGGRLLGCEYQLLGETGRSLSRGSCGSLYVLYEPNDKKRLNPIGDWNTAKIVAHGPKIEHWLNGEKIVEADLASQEWRKRLSKSKFAPHKDFARNSKGRIMITEHGSKVWYRNLILTPLPTKEIPPLAAAPRPNVVNSSNENERSLDAKADKEKR